MSKKLEDLTREATLASAKMKKLTKGSEEYNTLEKQYRRLNAQATSLQRAEEGTK